jgi:HAD superfamily hydrolase (TIGR01509 family)
MKPKLIIFDLIGTLVSPETKKKPEEFFRFYQSLGINLNTKEKALKFQKIFVQAMKNSNSWEDLGNEIIKLIFKKENKEKGEKLSQFLKENLNYRLFDDAKEVLDFPYQKAILTEAPHFLFSHLNLERYFQIFTPKETKFSKPDERAFLTVLNFFKVKPEDALMVGDEIERDLIPAKKLGMEVILIDRENKIKDAQIKKISSLKELKNLIQF